MAVGTTPLIPYNRQDTPQAQNTGTRKEKKTPFTHLPKAIIRHICFFLSFEDQGSTYRSCRATHLTAADKALVVRQQIKIDNTLTKDTFRVYSLLMERSQQVLNLSNVRAVVINNQNDFCGYSTLKNGLIDAITEHKASLFPNVTSLSALGQEGEKHIRDVILGLPHLKVISVSKSFDPSCLPASKCSKLKTLSFGYTENGILDHVLLNCLKLTSLSFNPQPTDAGLVRLGKQCSEDSKAGSGPYIQHLTLSGVSLSGCFKQIARGISNDFKQNNKSMLLSLSIPKAHYAESQFVYNDFLLFLGIGHPHLEQVTYDFNVEDTGLKALATNCPNLKKVSIGAFVGTLEGLKQLSATATYHFAKVVCRGFTIEQFVSAIDALSPKPNYTVDHYEIIEP